MKKTIFITLLLTIFCVGMAQAKKRPQIQFEQTNVDVGTFPESDPIRTVQFKFKNVGNAKLVINNVTTSCGCTVADYPKDFIAPGASGVITVRYDGKGKFPGRFRKGINVFTNNGKDVTRLYIEGVMTAPQQTS